VSRSKKNSRRKIGGKSKGPDGLFAVTIGENREYPNITKKNKPLWRGQVVVAGLAWDRRKKSSKKNHAYKSESVQKTSARRWGERTKEEGEIKLCPHKKEHGKGNPPSGGLKRPG